MGKAMNEKLGHSDEADGIEEYDNALPDWWVGLFVISVVFAAIYPVWFHGMEGHTQAAAYDIEMAAAEERWPAADPIAELPSDPETLQAGSEIFAQTCASCHNANMTGGIGPNLIDDEWIHGGSGPEILDTVTNGVAAKGMPAWGAILGPEKVKQVAAFVYSKSSGSAEK